MPFLFCSFNSLQASEAPEKDTTVLHIQASLDFDEQSKGEKVTKL